MNTDEFNVEKMCLAFWKKRSVLYKHTISIGRHTSHKFLEWAGGTLGLG